MFLNKSCKRRLISLLSVSSLISGLNTQIEAYLDANRMANLSVGNCEECELNIKEKKGCKNDLTSEKVYYLYYPNHSYMFVTKEIIPMNIPLSEYVTRMKESGSEILNTENENYALLKCGNDYVYAYQTKKNTTFVSKLELMKDEPDSVAIIFKMYKCKIVDGKEVHDENDAILRFGFIRMGKK